MFKDLGTKYVFLCLFQRQYKCSDGQHVYVNVN